MSDIRLASIDDAIAIERVFYEMLRELAPYGHDIKPTQKNVDWFIQKDFLPSIAKGEHGIVLAGNYGGVITTPERVAIDVPEKRAICWAAWVDPLHRKEGLASQMLNLSYNTMKALGYREVISHVLVDNVPSIHLCRRFRAKTKALRISFSLD